MPIFPASATLAWKAGALLSTFLRHHFQSGFIKKAERPSSLSDPDLDLRGSLTLGDHVTYSFERDHGRCVWSACARAEVGRQGRDLGEGTSSPPFMLLERPREPYTRWT